MGNCMLTLDASEIFVPDHRVPIMSLEKETQLPKEMLSIYHLFYGLKTIAVNTQYDLESFIAIPLGRLLSANSHTKINYIIYLHTTGILLSFGDAMLARLKKRFGLESAIAFGMTMMKCASYFKALAILDRLLLENSNESAVILTGEVAFAPSLRVVPRSTIVGDAATASLFSKTCENHRLLFVSNRFIPGYAKGIYLSEREIQCFDAIFIREMTNTILEAVSKSGLFITDIALILPHNVNIPTWKNIALMLKMPIQKIFLNNIDAIGHAFCSDHTINLKSAVDDYQLKKGDYYVMAGCGMGFYLSAAVFQY